jgi:hypothetical protein
MQRTSVMLEIPEKSVLRIGEIAWSCNVGHLSNDRHCEVPMRRARWSSVHFRSPPLSHCHRCEEAIERDSACRFIKPLRLACVGW